MAGDSVHVASESLGVREERLVVKPDAVVFVNRVLQDHLFCKSTLEHFFTCNYNT